MKDPIRILIVDDHGVVRGGLRAVLETKSDLEVVGDAASGREAIRLAETLAPDVILMDLRMPGEIDGIEATRRIREQSPEAKILVLTTFDNDHLVISSIQAGALGYVLKEKSTEELVQSIRGVYQGTAQFDPEISRRLIVGDTRPGEEAQVLTERETEVIRQVAQGKTNQDIGAALNITPRTVGTHVSNMLEKLDLENRTQLALYALRHEIASLDDLTD
jgi:NarL family two-component system response regulator LiaR